MLEHASGSQHIDPGRPPAAAGGLVSHRCQTSFLAPSAAADSGELQQAGRRYTTRSFGMSSKVCIDWVASAITPGRRSLNGRAAGDVLGVVTPPNSRGEAAM